MYNTLSTSNKHSDRRIGEDDKNSLIHGQENNAEAPKEYAVDYIVRETDNGAAVKDQVFQKREKSKGLFHLGFEDSLKGI